MVYGAMYILVTSGEQAKLMILTLESKETQFPKHLNKEQIYRRQRVNTGTGSVQHAERARQLPYTISLETSWECSSEATVDVWHT